jgi:Leucine-rich repeat (LRR) protein
LEIDLDDNYLSGSIEKAFVNCKNLTQLVLMNNQIVGSIPNYLSELPLMVLDLDNNNFSGQIPSSLWNLSTLMEFSAANNQLEGSLPMEIGNAVILQRLVLSNNRLIGTIPKEIGSLSSLSVFNLNGNMLEGNIPSELGDCISLTTLDLGNNQLNGSIPDKLVKLSELQCLVLSHNNLSGSIPAKESSYFRQLTVPDLSFVQHLGVLDLSHNRLSGTIPDELGNCVVVVDLLLSNNMFSGSIPRSLSRLTNLTTLDLSGNLLSGSIPLELGDAVTLQGLYLGQNQLSGAIPGSFGKLTRLVKLNLTGNMLYGPIPISFGNMKELTHLDLSYNELTGELPSIMSGVQSLVGLYVQNNRLSGHVGELFSNSMTWRIETMNLSCNCFDGNLPWSLGNLSYLTILDLHRNQLTGEIPLDLGNLMQLEYFDVSGNQLSGKIPEKLCSLVNLNYLDLSQNRLEGPIPRTGICQNLSRVRFLGNRNLCGQMLGTNCEVKSIGRYGLFNAWRLGGIAITVILITLIFAFLLHRWISRKHNDPEELEDRKLNSYVDQNLYFLSSSRSKEPLSINVAMFEQPLLKLTLVDILEATDNFCKTNIIGDGGFGTVYRATLPNGKTVAVKKLSEAKTQGHREFMAEMETLGKVKHQNLVALLGYCSMGEEKLLVYEYMVNGSLDLWLRNRTGGLEILDWNKRYKIATGAAKGLAFLHHGFIPHIIHRDVKASNILLNEDFEPKVADFGLARLISACETHITTDIAGTFGYIPPEYGQSGRSTTRGDVYSFGVILLELVTGKEPTGPNFKDIEGGNLVGWVGQKIKKGQAAEVLDPTVLDADSKQMMLQMLQIACVCLSDNPANRPTMFQVHKFLKGMKGDISN